MTKRLFPLLLIVLAGVLAYWNSFDGVFLYDDVTSVRDNVHIRQLWPLSEAMSLPLWNTAYTVDGRPLLSLSFALNHALFGPDVWGYHLVNLLIHIGAGLLLFGIVRRTIRGPASEELRRGRQGAEGGPFDRAQGGRATWLALAAALIWLVHPLQTQSVTYIVQRSESLMGMLFLLTLYCSIRGFDASCQLPVASCQSGKSQDRAEGGTGEGEDRGQGSGARSQESGGEEPITNNTAAGWQIAAVAACAIGTGVKEIIYAAPLLVLMYDWTFVSESFGKAISKRRWFYAGLFSTWSIIFAIKFLGWSGETSYFEGISPVRYAMTQPMVILHYLRLAVWPDPLVLAYGWQLADQWPRIVFPGLAIIGMLVVMFRGIWKRRWYGFLLAWFFLILAPTSSIAPMRQVIFEHRMYLSLAAVVMFVVMGGDYAVRKMFAAPKQRAAFGVGLTMAIVLALGYRTHARNEDYSDAVHFWQDNVFHSPRHPLAHLNLGHALQEAGRATDAIPHFREALRLKPEYAEAHYNWGVALDALDDPEGAAAHYRQAVNLKPGYPEAYSNLGNALLALGMPQESLRACLEAARLQPDLSSVHVNLGNTLMALGDPTQALISYRKALQVDPSNAEAHYNMGVALDAAGKTDEAMGCYEKAIQLDSSLVAARYNLANGLLAGGRYEEAALHYRRIRTLEPAHFDACKNLAIALHGLGQIDDAIAMGLKAAEINPSDASAHYNLGLIYRESGRLTDAIMHFEQAVRLRPDNALAKQNLLETRKLMGEGETP